MESNKDEAVRCIELAVQFYNEKQLSQALKFIKKSISLYPTPKAEELLKRIESELHQTSHNSAPSSHHDSTATSAHKPSPVQHDTPSSAPATKRTYTQEQYDAVVKVKKCSKDYYAVLEITRDASENVIKKQYRKLALLMHPDKNSAPGAEEAFKVVSQAFACLSDPAKKKHYDLYGHESVNNSSVSSGGGGFRRQGGVYEADISPEELFEMMFGLRSTGGFRTYSYQSGMGARQHRHASNNTNHQDSNSGGGFTIMQIMPLLLLLFSIIIMSAITSSSEETQFVLKKMAPYNVERVTNRRHVLYYVDAHMEEKIVHNLVNLADLENNVEQVWRHDMEKKCVFERQQKQRMERAANYYSDSQQAYMREKANAFKMESCEALYAS